jgi:hypothetical protein
LIKSIHNGRLSALFFLILLIVPVHFLHVQAAFSMDFSSLISIPFLNTSFGIVTWSYAIILVAILIIQGIWFGRIMNRYQFFESNSPWPMVAYFILSITIQSQLLHLNVILFNFVFLYTYDRLFSLSEDEPTNYQLYMDIGSVYGVGLLFFPEGIFLLPLLLIAANQFAVLDINRFLLFLLSICMILVPAIVLVYLYVTRVWIGEYFIKILGDGFSFSVLLKPEILYTYIALAGSLLLLIPTVLRKLGHMQNQNRKIFTVMLVHIVLGIMVTFFTSTDKGAVLFIVSIPMIFIFALGSGHLNRTWLSNIMMILLLFALIFIQWVYIYNPL